MLSYALRSYLETRNLALDLSLAATYRGRSGRHLKSPLVLTQASHPGHRTSTKLPLGKFVNFLTSETQAQHSRSVCAQGAVLTPTKCPAMEEFQVPEDMGNPSALQVEAAGRFCASKDLPSLRDESAESLNDRLDGVDSRLAHGEVDALSEQDNFDDMFSLVR